MLERDNGVSGEQSPSVPQDRQVGVDNAIDSLMSPTSRFNSSAEYNDPQLLPSTASPSFELQKLRDQPTRPIDCQTFIETTYAEADHQQKFEYHDICPFHDHDDHQLTHDDHDPQPLYNDILPLDSVSEVGQSSTRSGSSMASEISKASAGGEPSDVYRKLLHKAGLRIWPDSRPMPSHLPFTNRISDLTDQAELSAKEKILGQELEMLGKKREACDMLEMNLQNRMNAIIEKMLAYSGLRLETYISAPWNRFPATLSSCKYLSAPTPDTIVGYPDLLSDGTDIPLDPEHPLGRAALQKILTSEIADTAPTCHNNASRFTAVHDILVIEYEADSREANLEVALNSILNVGLFKVWQEVDLMFALEKDLEWEVMYDPPFFLGYRICGEKWSVEYVSPVTPVQRVEHMTFAMTIAEGDWSKDSEKFLRTLRAVFMVSEERVNQIRGRSMKELVAKALECQVSKTRPGALRISQLSGVEGTLPVFPGALDDLAGLRSALPDVPASSPAKE